MKMDENTGVKFYNYNQENTKSLDEALGPVIVGGLKEYLALIEKLKLGDDTEICIPNAYKLSEIEKLNNEGFYTSSELAVNKWIQAIEKMIYAFEDDEPKLPDGIINMNYNEMSGGDVKVDILDKDGYSEHSKLYEIHYKKVEDGLELFAKHYRDLWW